MDTRGDCIRVVHPLFQEEGSGSIPTSPLQLEFGQAPLNVALRLNEEWHSRLPRLPLSTVQIKHGRAYAAIFAGRYFAVAVWSTPVARMLDDGTRFELRRMAIADDAPKNTASRMLGWMIRELKREGRWTQAISYQDTAVHSGTIYKASGWTSANTSATGVGWQTGIKNGWKRWGASAAEQAPSPKVRWEMKLKDRVILGVSMAKKADRVKHRADPLFEA